MWLSWSDNNSSSQTTGRWQSQNKNCYRMWIHYLYIYIYLIVKEVAFECFLVSSVRWRKVVNIIQWITQYFYSRRPISSRFYFPRGIYIYIFLRWLNITHIEKCRFEANLIHCNSQEIKKHFCISYLILYDSNSPMLTHTLYFHNFEFWWKQICFHQLCT